MQGNPSAVAAAEAFRSHQITGLVAMLLAAAAMTGGVTWGTALAASDRPNTQLAIPVGLVLGGLVAMLVGTCYFATAQPYQWDAINIYNDRAPPTPPLELPGYTSANESLRMRDR